MRNQPQNATQFTQDATAETEIEDGHAEKYGVYEELQCDHNQRQSA